MSKLLMSLFLSLHLLIFGCTSYWLEDGKTKREERPNSKVATSEVDKCNYDSGFKDSVSYNRPEDLCFLIKENSYRRGFLNGTRYTSRQNQAKSLENMLKSKKESLDALMKSGMAQHFRSGAIDEMLHEISEMKSSISTLNLEMTNLKNDSTTL